VKYDPVKSVKHLIERRDATTLWNVVFYDSVIEANNTELIGILEATIDLCLVFMYNRLISRRHRRLFPWLCNKPDCKTSPVDD
jgi:hypothetical protein